jgi:hypothetical protein
LRVSYGREKGFVGTGAVVNWRVRLTFEVEVEYAGSRLKWLARNNRNREGTTSFLREELRAALDQKLDELGKYGVTEWSVRAPASTVGAVRSNVIDSGLGTSD